MGRHQPKWKLIAVSTLTLDVLRLDAAQLKGDFVAYIDEIVELIAISVLQFYFHNGVLALAVNHNVALLWYLVIAKLAQTMSAKPMPELR